MSLAVNSFRNISMEPLCLPDLVDVAACCPVERVLQWRFQRSIGHSARGRHSEWWPSSLEHKAFSRPRVRPPSRGQTTQRLWFRSWHRLLPQRTNDFFVAVVRKEPWSDPSCVRVNFAAPEWGTHERLHSYSAEVEVRRERLACDLWWMEEMFGEGNIWKEINLIH